MASTGRPRGRPRKSVAPTTDAAPAKVVAQPAKLKLEPCWKCNRVVMAYDTWFCPKCGTEAKLIPAFGACKEPERRTK